MNKSHAAWISAAFHLKVIRVFLNATAPSTISSSQKLAIRDASAQPQLPPARAALPAPAAKLTEAQSRAIDERLGRVAAMFHPFSQQFADLIGVRRVLKGLHPASSLPVQGYRAVV